MTASAVPPRTLPIASWLAVGVTSPEAVTVHQGFSRQVETATPLAVAVAAAEAAHAPRRAQHRAEECPNRSHRAIGVARTGDRRSLPASSRRRCGRLSVRAEVVEQAVLDAGRPVWPVMSRKLRRTHCIVAEHCARIENTVQPP